MQETFLAGEGILLFVIKAGLAVFLLVYLIFSAVAIKQVRMMTETLEVGLESHLKFIVLLHFVVSLIVFLLAIFSL